MDRTPAQGISVSTSTTREQWVVIVEEYMNRCLRSKSAPRAAELAYELRVSGAQVTRLFKRSAGVGIKEFMHNRQLELACALLRETNDPASEIALRTGFGTTRTFFRAFRRAMGESPTEYRVRMRG